MMIADNADLHRAQRSFRQVLDAFARPGSVCVVEPDADDGVRPASLDGALCALARLFVDQAVTFAVADAESDAAARYLASETHARRAPVDEADFVIVPGRADARVASESIAHAKPGTPASPELGATVLLGCTHVASAPAADEAVEPGMVLVAVTGPGVKDANRFAVDRDSWVAARQERGGDFPCGIGIALVDPAGNTVAIPRTSAVAIEGGMR